MPLPCLLREIILCEVRTLRNINFYLMLPFQTPEKSEPVLADKEIIMAALNIKSMSFGANFVKVEKRDLDS